MSEEDFNKADEIEETENVNEDIDATEATESTTGSEEHAHYHPKKDDGEDDTVKYQLSGMYPCFRPPYRFQPDPPHRRLPAQRLHQGRTQDAQRDPQNAPR